MEPRVEKIAQAIEEQHISTQNLSAISSVSRSTIYRMLRGDTCPDTVTLDLLEDALDISPACGGTDAADSCTRCRQLYRRQILEKSTWLRREFAVCLGLSAFIGLLLVVDIASPNAGWLRR